MSRNTADSIVCGTPQIPLSAERRRFQCMRNAAYSILCGTPQVSMHAERRRFHCLRNVAGSIVCGTPRIPLSVERRRFQCMRNVSARVARSNAAMRACQCFPPCSEIVYDVSYSLSRWPAENFEGEQAYTDIFETEEYHRRFDQPEDAKKVMRGEQFQFHKI